MTFSQIRTLTASALLATSVLALSATAPTAAPNYDGVWSVLIVTEKGTCDRAYRYPVRIEKGSVLNDGPSIVNVSGRVGGNGAITVTVSAGDKSATGSGRLSGAVGAGRWSGAGCGGTWHAERRSS